VTNGPIAAQKKENQFLLVLKKEASRANPRKINTKKLPDGQEKAHIALQLLEPPKQHKSFKLRTKKHILTGRNLNMKGIVIYDTSTGNTKKIAETITETLKESGIESDLFYVKDLKKLSAKEYSFLVLGSPTKFGTMSFTMKSFLGKVKTEEWMNKPFAAFDTENPENVEKSRAENKNWSAGEKIAEKLKEKKMNQLLPVLKALVESKLKGMLLEGEIDKAKDYAKQLAAKLKNEAV
jgi:menaquinone-dependent protoporphyrinogen IX oxidase